MTYTPRVGKKQEGIVKRDRDPMKTIAFVVFHCNEDWERFEDYTGQSVKVEDLTAGWTAKEREYYFYDSKDYLMHVVTAISEEEALDRLEEEHPYTKRFYDHVTTEQQ